MPVAEIYPPTMPSPWWWAVVAVSLLAALAMVARGILVWHRAGREQSTGPDDLAQLRSETLASIDEALAQDSDPAAARALSVAVRRFVGLAGDTDADFQSADQLQFAARLDPRLRPAADLVTGLQDAAFGIDSGWDRHGHAELAREVVARWR